MSGEEAPRLPFLDGIGEECRHKVSKQTLAVVYKQSVQYSAGQVGAGEGGRDGGRGEGVECRGVGGWREEKS